jgi:hypothetical protein
MKPTEVNANHCARLPAAHAPAYRAVPRVACGLPERRHDLVLVRDQGCDAVGALPAHVLLACAHERQADAAAAVLMEHYEPVHVPPPSVPRGDQRAHECAAGVGDEQTLRCLGEQSVDVLDPVGGGCVRAARPLPQVEDRRRLVRSGCHRSRPRSPGLSGAGARSASYRLGHPRKA